MSDNDVTFTADERAYLESGDAEKLAAKPETEKEPEIEIDLGEDDQEKPAEQQDEKQRVVPHQALHAERMKRQAIERQLAETQAQYKVFEQRMAELQDAMKPKEAPPDPLQDPIAAFQYTQKQLDDLRKQHQQQIAQQQAQEREQVVIRQIEGAYTQSWQSKLAENADYANAYKAFIGTLDAHFQIRGVPDPQQRNELIRAEERAIAYQALQNGFDPADAIIQKAGVYGYKPTQTQNDPAKVLADKQKGLDAARSLSNARGGSSDTSLTPQKLAEMSVEDFEALKAKLSPAKFAKLMGAA